jgi:hypothetical protein
MIDTFNSSNITWLGCLFFFYHAQILVAGSATHFAPYPSLLKRKTLKKRKEKGI